MPVNKSIVSVLKEFGLTDDQILSIAIKDTLGESIKLLKEYIGNKWQMDTITAMQTAKKLKEELK
mgnify:CR=1 FL=1